MKNIKYILFSAVLIGFSACNDIEDAEEDFVTPEVVVNLPALTAGTADFSNYVALGASFTAGFTDSALFIAGQENSFPNILSQQFAIAGGGAFTQPLMNDNLGGIAAGGTQLPGASVGPRLVFGGAGPVPITDLIGPATSSTDLFVNNLTGPFNNMGVPGAKSFHLLSGSYGNIAGLGTFANPYFIRMASSSSASMLVDAISQGPTFFTLSEIGGNDVLAYATSGGSGIDQTGNFDPTSYGGNDITDPNVFANTFNGIVTALTSTGAKGVVANLPYITSLPHFTTVPHNPVPLDGATAGALNAGYATYNGGIIGAFAYLVSISAISQVDADLEIAKRTITFSAGANNAMVLIDEDLTDLTGINAGLINMRQATADDLFVLPLSSLIPLGYGTQIPLEDKWALTPEEQNAIKTATDAYNVTIKAVATANNLAFVDFNAVLIEASTSGIVFDDYIMDTSLVTGGAVGLDGIHLTSRGYALMANKFLEAIDATYGSNFVASGTVAKAGEYPTNYSPLLQ